MPRRGRLHINGGYYHVIGRGLERRYIFSDVDDKLNFLSRLGHNLAKYQVECLAWALMSNHYHLLLRVNQHPLSKIMAPVLGGYAGYYNRQHRRSGYVFQNRYQSILCDAECYLVQLVRYIHLNPVRAGMVETASELADYRWTGHASVFGRYSQPWHAVDQMLAFFGHTKVAARSNYQLLINEIAPIDHGHCLSGGGLIRSSGGWEALSRLRKEHADRVGDERILGDASFVRNSLNQDVITIDFQSELERSGWTLDLLINKVCKYVGVDELSLLRKARHSNASLAKSLVCYWGTEVLGLTAKEVAERLNLSHSAVSYRVNTGRCYCEDNRLEFTALLKLADDLAQ